MAAALSPASHRNELQRNLARRHINLIALLSAGNFGEGGVWFAR